MWTFKKELFKTISLDSIVSCGGSVSATGSRGIYELELEAGLDTGRTGVVINSRNVPDRFQIYYDDELVADTKFIGDALVPGPPVDVNGMSMLGNYDLNVYSYNGVSFDDTSEIITITIGQDDLANNETEATGGYTTLFFNKETAEPTKIKLVVTGVNNSTIWDLIEFICPFTSSIKGAYGVYYGFLEEANKTLKNMPNGRAMSKKLYYSVDPLNPLSSKYYLDERSEEFDFSLLGWTSSKRFINNQEFWIEIDTYGNVLSQGAI